MKASRKKSTHDRKGVAGTGRRIWSGRILKPAKPTSVTLAEIRKAVREQRREKEGRSER